jgi:hypothetical protein
MIMTKGDSELHNAEASCIAVVPLPIALYDSNGLLFELYDGGQPYRSFAIHWETIKPIRVSKEGDDNRRKPHVSEPA